MREREREHGWDAWMDIRREEGAILHWRRYAPVVWPLGHAFLKHFAEGAVVGAVAGQRITRAEDLIEFWADLSTVTKGDNGLFSSRKYA